MEAEWKLRGEKMRKKTLIVILLIAAFVILPSVFLLGRALMPQKVFLHANGGEWKSSGKGEMYPNHLESDGSDRMVIPEYPERSGYVFKMFKKEVPEQITPQEGKEDEKILYAYWEKLEEGDSQLIYYLNDTTFRSQPLGKLERHSDQTIQTIGEVNTNWSVPLGKKFVGWATEQSPQEGEQMYQPGQVMDLKARDNRLYARYEDVPFTVSFGMGEAPGAPPAAQAILAGQLAQNPGDPAWGDYIFDGWFEEGSTKPWNFDTSSMPYKNLMLTARWSKQKQYIVKFNLNGAPGVVPDQQILYAGDAIAQPAPPHWEGYTFEGWYLLEASSSGDNWNFARESMPAYNVTLYARWKRLDAPVQPWTQSSPKELEQIKQEQAPPVPAVFHGKEVPLVPTDMVQEEQKPNLFQIGVWDILRSQF